MAAKCSTHAEADSLAPCARCGTFCCAECLATLPPTPLCHACTRRIPDWGFDGAAYSASVAALIFGAIAVAFLPAAVLSVPASAFVLRRDPKVDPRSRKRARLGLYLAGAGAVILSVFLLFGG